eukprot:g2624.t1
MASILSDSTPAANMMMIFPGKGESIVEASRVLKGLSAAEQVHDYNALFELVLDNCDEEIEVSFEVDVTFDTAKDEKHYYNLDLFCLENETEDHLHKRPFTLQKKTPVYQTGFTNLIAFQYNSTKLRKTKDLQRFVIRFSYFRKGHESYSLLPDGRTAFQQGDEGVVTLKIKAAPLQTRITFSPLPAYEEVGIKIPATWKGLGAAEEGDSKNPQIELLIRSNSAKSVPVEFTKRIKSYKEHNEKLVIVFHIYEFHDHNRGKRVLDLSKGRKLTETPRFRGHEICHSTTLAPLMNEGSRYIIVCSNNEQGTRGMGDFDLFAHCDPTAQIEMNLLKDVNHCAWSESGEWSKNHGFHNFENPQYSIHLKEKSAVNISVTPGGPLRIYKVAGNRGKRVVDASASNKADVRGKSKITMELAECKADEHYVVEACRYSNVDAQPHTLNVVSHSELEVEALPTFEDYLDNMKGQESVSCEEIVNSSIVKDSEAQVVLGKKDYVGVAAACGTQKKFIDSVFGKEEALKNIDDTEIRWVRATDSTNEAWLFKDGLEPDDIRQGALGNCWLCCLLACFAHTRPEIIYRIFGFSNCTENNVSIRANSRGFYYLNLYVASEDRWGYVLIDDHIPTRSSQYRAFQPTMLHSSNGSEIWPGLLEKGFAKLAGCYKNLTGSLDTEILGCRNKQAGVVQAMTGIREFDNLKLSAELSSDELFQKLQTYIKNEWIVTCGTKQLDKGTEDAVGLASRHAYSIIGCVELSSRFSKQVIYRLRNPWGEKEWLGKWGDNDDAWKDSSFIAWVNACATSGGDYIEEDDGTFFIGHSDFLQYFDSVNLFKITDNEYPFSRSVKGTWKVEKDEPSRMIIGEEINYNEIDLSEKNPQVLIKCDSPGTKFRLETKFTPPRSASQENFCFRIEVFKTNLCTKEKPWYLKNWRFKNPSDNLPGMEEAGPFRSNPTVEFTLPEGHSEFIVMLQSFPGQKGHVNSTFLLLARASNTFSFEKASVSDVENSLQSYSAKKVQAIFRGKRCRKDFFENNKSFGKSLFLSGSKHVRVLSQVINHMKAISISEKPQKEDESSEEKGQTEKKKSDTTNERILWKDESGVSWQVLFTEDNAVYFACPATGESKWNFAVDTVLRYGSQEWKVYKAEDGAFFYLNLKTMKTAWYPPPTEEDYVKAEK